MGWYSNFLILRCIRAFVCFETADLNYDVIKIRPVKNFCLVTTVNFRAIIVDISASSISGLSFLVGFRISVPILDSADCISGIVHTTAVGDIKYETITLSAEVGEPLVVDCS